MYFSSSNNLILLVDCAISVFFLISVSSPSVSSDNSNNNKCNLLNRDSHSSKDLSLPKIESSTKLDNLGKILVEFHCIAKYPIKWSFDRFPEGLTVWNVTYLRDAENILKKSSYLYNSTLTLLISSKEEVDYLGPSCSSVDDVCRFSRASINGKNATIGGTSGTEELKTTTSSAGDSHPDCSVNLWYDSYLKIYVCKIENGTVLPKMSNKYCANPTECGMFQDKDQASGCPLKDKPLQYKDCFDAGVICATLNEDVDASVPSIVSCWNGEATAPHVPTSVLDFPDTNIVVDDGHPETYDGPHGSRIQLQASDKNPIAQVPFDVECTAPYFFFATGLHITLKPLERRHFTEIDIGPCPGNITFCQKSFPMGLNVSVQEDLEIRNQSGILEVPVKKILLVRGLTLDSGDWEVACYAPVWNSSEWTYKSELFTVKAPTLPKFLAGTGTKDIQFRPTKNVTCMARSVPPPKLTWIYDRDRLPEQLISVGGQQDDLAWSILTIPSVLPGMDFEFKCHAENQAGAVEKTFVLNKSGNEYAVVTKVAAALVIVLGILVNVLVVYCCWRILYAEKDENGHHMPAVKFLRHLLFFRKCPTMGNHHHHHHHQSSTRSTNALHSSMDSNTTQSTVVAINSRGGSEWRKNVNSSV